MYIMMTQNGVRCKHKTMKMNIKQRLCLLVAVIGTMCAASGQNVAVKSNLLNDAMMNVNAGLEFGLARRWTLDITADYNGWTINERKWKHWLLQPEFRYWFCDRFTGHFLGFHAMGGQYNFGNLQNGISMLGSDLSKLSYNRYQGWAVGGGIAYGHAWILGKHWNFELEVGFGYLYTRFDSYECQECGSQIDKDAKHHYIGPTKAAVNLVYLF